MRKLILNLAVSLDGLIEGPNGEYDWCFEDPDEDYGMIAFLERVDSMFLGRKSYELTQNMGEEGMAGFSHLKEYVFSTTLKEGKPGAVLINGDVEKEVKRIKQGPGKDIWLFGGASLTTSLLNLGLVDEIGMAVHPIILGAGRPLFQDISERKNLELVEAKSYSSGLVFLTYRLMKE